MEFNWTELILALIAVLASVVTHQLDKRKHAAEIAKLRAETDSDTIANLDKALDFYEKSTRSTNKRLEELLANQEEMLKENTDLKEQISTVHKKMTQLAAIICTKLSCVYREVDHDIVECLYHPEKRTETDTEKK